MKSPNPQPERLRGREGRLRRHRHRHRTGCCISPVFDRLENRCVLSVSAFPAVVPIDLSNPTADLSGRIADSGGQAIYRVTLKDDGLLVAHVHASGFDTLLSLLDDKGGTLVQSQATSPTNPDDHLAQHLPTGTYYLVVTGQSGIGSYELTTNFTRTLPAYQALSEGTGSFSVTTADLNGDHIPDIVIADYFNDRILINFGVGDGTFQPPVSISVGSGPSYVLAADFTGSGIIDLAVANQRANTISILMGNGDGTFRAGAILQTGLGPTYLISGDFNGDGRPDLAVANQTDNSVDVFKGDGLGSFVESSRTDNLGAPASLASGDFFGDGHLSLAVASTTGGDVIILKGQGDGSFVKQRTLAVGPGCRTVIAADFNGDGHLDLAAVSPDDGKVSIFLSYAGFFEQPIRLTAGTLPRDIVAADFNGDGHLDLAVSDYGSNDVSLFRGLGDGSFQSAVKLPTGTGPTSLTAADLSGNGMPDLVTSDYIGLTVSVLRNNGDGTFISPPFSPPSKSPDSVVTADVNGDGIPDLVIPNTGTNEVSVLLGRGDGTFHDRIQSTSGPGPFNVAVGDFNGDHFPDLAAVDYFSNTVSILQGRGDGTFQLTASLKRASSGLGYIKAVDLDGDGHLDLVVANFLTNNVSIFYGRGDSTFADQIVVPVGYAPTGIVAGDFNGDGRPDLAVSDAGSYDVEVLLGTGGRTFAKPKSFYAGAQPTSIATSDLNGDGHLDLVVADYASASVAILLGAGDGTFGAPLLLPTGTNPYLLTIGDFNGDGHNDLLTGNLGSGDMSLLLGRGDGTFASALTVASGTAPFGLALADFNGDGHLDIATANNQSSNVIVDLGRGDGTFASPQTTSLNTSELPTITADLESNGVPDVIVANPDTGTITVSQSQGDGTLQLVSTITIAGRPSGLVVADFNGDGRPDLAVSDAQNGDVLILHGLGNGTFRDPIRFHVGTSPHAIVAADFTHNGIIDIAVANINSNDVSVLFGRGDGTFLPERRFAVGTEPVSLLVGDFNGDGLYDLATTNRTSHDITILLGTTDASFQPLNVQLPGITPSTVVVADFNGDGRIDAAIDDASTGLVHIFLDVASKLANNDGTPSLSFDVGKGSVSMVAADLDGNGKAELAVANANLSNVTIFSAWANGTFSHRYTVPLQISPAGLLVADLNNDTRLDLVITDAAVGDLEVYLASGNGLFSQPVSTVPLPGPAPLVVPDGGILSIDQKGNELRRDPLPNLPSELGAALNLSAGTGIFTLQTVGINTDAGWSRVALTANQPFLVLTHPTDAGLEISHIGLPSVGSYTRIAAGDLFSEGRDDLVVLDHGANQILIYRQDAEGHFAQYGRPICIGLGPTDLTVADVNGDGRQDIVVSNGSSGDISVIHGGPGGIFGAEIRLRAGMSTAGTTLIPEGLKRSSPDEPIGVTTGVFDHSGLTDVVVVDGGTDRISLLKGTPGGGLADPNLATTYTTGLHPTEAVAARLGRDPLLGDSPLLDIAVLNEGSQDISIFMNDGHGGFVTMPRVDAGDKPTGFTVRDVNNDGVPDLVVGNNTGDVLLLLGNGDGTFRPYSRADHTVNLAVGDLNGDGKLDFVFSDTSKDLLSVQYPGSTAGFLQGRGNGILAPGPVAIADLNGDGIPDLIVTNRGGNDVLVYLGLGNSQFAAPQRFFTGTAPVGLTIADLNGDGLPDLIVTNEGSNDISILLGDWNNGWTLDTGPRLSVGERPVSTTVADVNGDGIKDILCVNQDSNSVTLLYGLGGGFFDDRNPRTFATGQTPVQAFFGHFSDAPTSGLVVLNSISSTMTYYAGLLSGNEAPVTLSSGGLNPVAGISGDFNKDGFSDLVVANGGDSRIALFLGGPHGLVLANSVSLGVSNRVTDLAFVPEKEGGVRLFVSTEGQAQAISILLSSGDFTLTPIANVANGVSAPSTSASFSHATSSFDPLSLLNATSFEPGTRDSDTQGVTSAQMSAPFGGAISQTGFAFAIVSQVVRPFLNTPFATLSKLIDTIIQKRQSQTSDMLPLGDTGGALVAVILSVTSTSDLAEGDDPLIETRGEGHRMEFALYPEDRAPSPPTALDRFLADPDSALARLPGDLGEQPGPQDDLGPEWVWRRRRIEGYELAFAVADNPSFHAAEARSGPEADALPGIGSTSPNWPVDEAPSSADINPPRLLARTALIAIATLSTGVAVWQGIQRRMRRELRTWANAVNPPTDSTRRKRSPGETRSLGARSKMTRDLPPWLQEPVSDRVGRTRISKS